MKVFKVVPESTCVGGCVIIAANTKEEVINILFQDTFNEFLYEWYNCRIEIVEDVICNSDKPKLIISAFHICDK